MNVSAAAIVLNSTHKIKKTLKQPQLTDANFECVIADTDSVDGAFQVIEDYPKNYKLISEPDLVLTPSPVVYDMLLGDEIGEVL